MLFRIGSFSSYFVELLSFLESFLRSMECMRASLSPKSAKLQYLDKLSLLRGYFNDEPLEFSEVWGNTVVQRDNPTGFHGSTYKGKIRILHNLLMLGVKYLACRTKWLETYIKKLKNWGRNVSRRLAKHSRHALRPWWQEEHNAQLKWTLFGRKLGWSVTKLSYLKRTWTTVYCESAFLKSNKDFEENYWGKCGVCFTIPV